MFVPQTLQDHLSPTAGMPMIFVHTPKCGGRFVTHTFGRRYSQCVTCTTPAMAGHQTWRDYRDGMRALHLDINHYVTFTVIRDPWSWHQSWYRYIRGDKGGRRSGMPVEHALFQNISFLEYLRWLAAPGITGQSNRYYLAQVSDWLVDEAGVPRVEHILRQERLRDDLEALRDTYGLRVTLPRKPVNTSRKPPDCNVSYTAEGIDIVARRHARDIALFGYAPPEAMAA